MPSIFSLMDPMHNAIDTYILPTAPWNNRGDFLIDDSIKNGAGEFRGELIRFGNTDYPNWESVVEYLLGRVEGIKNFQITRSIQLSSPVYKG